MPGSLARMEHGIGCQASTLALPCARRAYLDLESIPSPHAFLRDAWKSHTLTRERRMNNMFLLFQFMVIINDNYKILVTRGRNAEEAYMYVRKCYPCANITTNDTCVIDAAKIYSRNHPFDWMNTPMRWLTH